MSAEQNHKVPGSAPYSGRNRIPNIKEFAASLDRDKRERDAKIDAELKANKRGDGGIQDHKNTNQHRAGKGRVVTDPVTGKEIEIDDVQPDFESAVENPHLSIPNANLGKDTPIKTEATQSGEEYREAQDVTAPPDPVANGSTSDVPIHGEKTNVLFHPTPSVSYEPMYAIIEQRATILCVGVFLAIIFVGKMFGGRLVGLIPLAICVGSGIFLWMKDLVRQGRDIEWSSEQKRGETATINLLPESVEWMNTLLGIVWGLVNPDMFSAVADTLEDVMQASVPGIIENVKVADISQGNNPIRILSLRALPDAHMKDVKEKMHEENKKTKDPQELAADEEGGDYYNLEASFAYHAKPSSGSVSGKAANMGMQLVFYLGVKGLFGVPLPIWVELSGLVGTVRIRLQMSPEPPFLKAVTFTLMGVPKVAAGCTPMIEHGVNILNLPLISNFVNWAIATAAGMYVAPKSMTLDLGKMLQGDDIQKETVALGILFIRIHKATGLSKQDRRGSEGGGSDPYITVSFSKFGKPMYCTRVIQDDLNPVFEETCALSVTADLIKVDEQLSMELWDSDRSSADDVVGKVELSLQKLIQHPGKMYQQVSKLRGVKAESNMPGELHWEVGFFGKTQFRSALRTDGKDLSLPPELRDRKELQDDKGAVENEQEDAVTHTPPDPLWPSGILSIVVHQIVSLELADTQGSEGGKRKGGKEYEPARDAGEIKEEQSKKLPSAYCAILLNDELVYKTRTKVVSSKPIFNAGTERFVRDWRSTIVTVAVRDSRNRQHDPLIGVVPLKLSDIMQTSSQASRWYPLDGGIGFGRIRISLLFRSVELKLPPPQLGWDVGTFEFTSDQISATLTDSGHGKSKIKIKMRTGGSSDTIRRDKCTVENDVVRWDISEATNHARPRLPVRYRFRSPVFFEFHLPNKRHAEHFAALWLLELVDNEEKDFDIPVWKCDKPMRLSQNYITPENFSTIPDIKLEEVGRLRFRGRFKAGTDRDHLRFVSDNNSRETIETWEACFAEGVRKEEVTKELPPTVQKLHEESLTHGRDVLATASEADKKKWLSKDGTDWSGAFGKDPADFVNNDDDSTDHYDSDSDSEPADSPTQGIKHEDTDLGIQDATNAEYEEDGGEPGSSLTTARTNGTAASTSGASVKSSSSKNPITQYKDYKSKSRDLHRQHRGLMQWRPMRNVQFAKDEAKYAIRRVTKVGSLSGRQPDVETEV
ncbi:Uu.00g066330.m01.CDS01 [Anthostomella pinea]|uniref:Uu.00g066330.m01.CDS01 n=1 Tax=Anthostomella pinea TaxID=933095 RepID=A0AAI8VV50_9PEZI|nr:Uu.00g066330.m01.CDS01 [Anthostomella pinea]